MLVFYVKPSNYCNVDCTHCYLPESTRADKERIKEETLYDVISLIKNACTTYHQDSVNLIWHGGEPMLIKPDWYFTAISDINDATPGIDIEHSLQSSLIPYSSSWKALVHQHFNGCIGSSIDFSARTKNQSSEQYIEAWLKKVDNARSDGITIIPGMVPTANETNKARAIVDWFVSNDFSQFNIERYSFHGKTPIDWVDNRGHSSFLISIFCEIVRRLQSGEKTPLINTVAAAITGVEYRQPGDRWGTKCQNTFFVIEPSGAINSCPDRALHEDPFANVRDNNILFSDKRQHWIREQEVYHKGNHCYSCEYNTWCNSGCPITSNDLASNRGECSGYKAYLDKVKSQLDIPDVRDLLLDYIE